MNRLSSISTRWVSYALCAGVAVLGACHPTDYTGTYIGHHPFGADTLILRPDSTYYHSFYPPDGPRSVDRGRWSGWSLKEFDRLDVQNFDWRIPGIGGGDAQDTINSSWPAQIEQSLLGNTYIAIDEGLDYYYLKIK